MAKIKVIGEGGNEQRSIVRIVPSLSLLRKLEPSEAVQTLRKRLIQVMEEGLYKTHKPHIEAYLKDPDNERLSNDDLEFLCYDLGIKRSAFVLLGNHCQFMTAINKDETRVYDPMREGVHVIQTSKLMENPDKIALTHDLRKDFYNQYNQRSANLIDYLIQIGYRKPEHVVGEMKPIQVNNMNDCIPLCIYVAANATKIKAIS